jgi:ABC-type iron transport system FetAB permease component
VTRFWREIQETETNLAVAIIHAIVFLLVVGYAQNYYFHLRKSDIGPLDGVWVSN